MNKTEAKYAEQLEADRQAGLILWWVFEPFKLNLAKRTTLTVDFLVMNADGTMELIDVKGHVEDDAMVKMKVAANKFWPFAFYLVKRGKNGWVKKEVLG